MIRYFYVKEIFFQPDKKIIEKIKGYFTDQFHNSFLPPEFISRQKAIEMINAGNILFIEDKSNHRIRIKLINVENDLFLRIDKLSQPYDYLGK
ncbi:MAG: hypothetical protein CVU42_12580 [Chloroflexi bacterium HGW-Chloroflexi-4]|jgi:hypothetical protein|nr:MAG: hypothetical protein CVU42_12580 [Chloroflexi bacterium HGW-Chloroflexi-4]